MPRNNTIDLNIGTRCLDNWENHHAIRELIANAMDEHIISKITKPISINHSKNKCEIIDYGSGITKSSFVIQSNSNKLNNEKLIGQFGFGMKDAICVLCKNDIDVTIYTKDFIFTPSYTQRANTSDITLHITFKTNNDYDDDDDNYGTKIVLNNIKKADIEKAKDYFIDFTTIKFDKLYSESIMKLSTDSQYIFVNKFRICKTKKNTYFSYNIKKTKDVMKLFNRDRGDKEYLTFRKIIGTNLKDIDIYNDRYSTEKLRKGIQKVFESDNLREFNQIDIIRNILSQFNNSDEYIFVDVKDRELVKKKKYINKIKDSGRKIMFIGSGILKKINSVIKTEKIKNIKELCEPSKIFTRNEKGLFTLSSPAMFPPSSIDELVKNIKEMINTYKTTLEITISKKIEKNLITIELIDDDEDEDDDNAGIDKDKDKDNNSDIDNDEKNKTDNEQSDEDEDEEEDKKKNEEEENDNENDEADEDIKNKDYYFEDGIFKIKKSVIENANRTNELKAVVFDYILKNIKQSDSIKILEKLMGKKTNEPWYKNFF
jgi:hypothetical protein